MSGHGSCSTLPMEIPDQSKDIVPQHSEEIPDIESQLTPECQQSFDPTEHPVSVEETEHGDEETLPTSNGSENVAPSSEGANNDISAIWKGRVRLRQK